MTIYQSYEIKTDRVDIKFVVPVKTTTLINANFILRNLSIATPSNVPNAFKPIVVTRDYYSTSRTLYLYWNDSLVDSTDYSLTITGLKNVMGETIPDEVILFTTTGTEVETIIDPVAPPSRDPVDVEDYSVKSTLPLFPSSILTSLPTTFAITSIKPAVEDAAYLDPSFNEGRVEIYFTDIPAANFISSDFFKVQRKKLMAGLVRWEDVNALITSSPEDRLVIIYMPSQDTIPQYGEPDLIYWEEGYKYRIRISSQIGPATITSTVGGS